MIKEGQKDKGFTRKKLGEKKRISNNKSRGLQILTMLGLSGGVAIGSFLYVNSDSGREVGQIIQDINIKTQTLPKNCNQVLKAINNKIDYIKPTKNLQKTCNQIDNLRKVPSQLAVTWLNIQNQTGYSEQSQISQAFENIEQKHSTKIDNIKLEFDKNMNSIYLCNQALENLKNIQSGSGFELPKDINSKKEVLINMLRSANNDLKENIETDKTNFEIYLPRSVYIEESQKLSYLKNKVKNIYNQNEIILSKLEGSQKTTVELNEFITKTVFDTIGGGKKYDENLATIENQFDKEKIDRAIKLLNSAEKDGRDININNTPPIQTKTNKLEKFVELAENNNQVILQNIETQRFYVYQDGMFVFSVPMTSGSPKTPTPTDIVGSVSKKQKDRQPISPYTGKPYGANIKYDRVLAYFRGSLYGIHDAYRWFPESCMGTDIWKIKGSHGCTRTPLDDVKFVYDNINKGTPVYNIKELWTGDNYKIPRWQDTQCKTDLEK